MSTEGMDRRLHRYFDGDLPAEEREALEREIADDEVLGRKLVALGDVRTLVRSTAEQSISDADSAAMWAAIENGAELGTSPASAKPATASAPQASVANDAKSPRPALRLVGRPSDSTEDRGAPAPTAEIDPASRPSAPVAEDPLTRRRRRFGVGIGLLALAAAVVLAFVRPGDPAPRDGLATTDGTTPLDERDGIPDSMRTEVLAVDFGTNVGTIFAVEGTAGQRYAVVWLDDAVKIDEGGASPEQAPN